MYKPNGRFQVEIRELKPKKSWPLPIIIVIRTFICMYHSHTYLIAIGFDPQFESDYKFGLCQQVTDTEDQEFNGPGIRVWALPDTLRAPKV